MFLGILPDWAGDLISIAGAVFGLPAIVLWFLNRKGANRKLVVEEGGLTVAQFNAALPAYKDLLDREKQNVDDARKEIDRYKAEREGFNKDLDSVKRRVDQIGDLLVEVIRSNNIQLTPSQQDIFKDTLPRHRLPDFRPPEQRA